MDEVAELIEDRPGQDVAVAADAPANMLALIWRATIDERVDIAKMRALLEMKKELEADQARIRYFAAMNAAQAEIQPVARIAENSQTRSFYAKLEDVDKAIRPIYLRHGFALSYDTVAPLIAGNIRIECTCAHLDGHAEKFGREAPADTLGPKGSAVKTVLHGGASTETFLKRYLACGIFNVVFKDRDDDGVAGGHEPISAGQLANLTALRERAQVSAQEFCRRWHIDAVADLPIANFTDAMNGLSSRATKLEAQQEAQQEPEGETP